MLQMLVIFLEDKSMLGVDVHLCTTVRFNRVNIVNREKDRLAWVEK